MTHLLRHFLRRFNLKAHLGLFLLKRFEFTSQPFCCCCNLLNPATFFFEKSSYKVQDDLLALLGCNVMSVGSL